MDKTALIKEIGKLDYRIMILENNDTVGHLRSGPYFAELFNLKAQRGMYQAMLRQLVEPTL